MFHAASQSADLDLPVAQLLVEHGADLSIRVRLRGHYHHGRPGEVIECKPPRRFSRSR